MGETGGTHRSQSWDSVRATGHGEARQAHCVAAVLLHHHSARKGLIVCFYQQRPLSPVQDVSLNEDHVLHTSDLRRRSPREKN